MRRVCGKLALLLECRFQTGEGRIQNGGKTLQLIPVIARKMRSEKLPREIRIRQVLRPPSDSTEAIRWRSVGRSFKKTGDPEVVAGRGRAQKARSLETC